jgi:Mor family transcriptional regulator
MAIKTSSGAPRPDEAAAAANLEDEVAYLAKRHRISPAIIREIIRRIGSHERAAVEREIKKGMARR